MVTWGTYLPKSILIYWLRAQQNASLATMSTFNAVVPIRLKVLQNLSQDDFSNAIIPISYVDFSNVILILPISDDR